MRRAERMREAQSASSEAERQKIVIPDCRQYEPPRSTPGYGYGYAYGPPLPQVPYEPQRPRWRKQGLSIDVAAGIGIGIRDGQPDPEPFPGIVGPNLGIGWFVAERFVFGLRLAGVSGVGVGAFEFLGALGPSVQGWMTDQFWLAATVGPGVSNCDCESGWIGNGRLGLSVKPDGGAFFAIDVTRIEDATIIGLQVGYQSFGRIGASP
jgi:hypothetical protein